MPFPGRFKKDLMEKYRAIFDKHKREAEIRMPLIDTFSMLPAYQKFLKDAVNEKGKEIQGMVVLTEECSEGIDGEDLNQGQVEKPDSTDRLDQLARAPVRANTSPAEKSADFGTKKYRLDQLARVPGRVSALPAEKPVIFEEKKQPSVPPPYKPKLPFPGRFKKDKDVTMVDNKGSVDCIDSPSTTKIEPKSLPKLGNPGMFSIACSLGDLEIKDALCDSGSSVNVMSHEMLQSLGIGSITHHPSPITFGDAHSRKPLGLLEDYPLKVGDCIVPTDFIVMEMKKTNKLPLLLGTPFLNTTGANMDFKNQRVVLMNVDDKAYYSLKASPNELCGTMTIKDDGYRDEKVQYIGTVEKVDEAPPPKVYDKKKKSLERKDRAESTMNEQGVRPFILGQIIAEETSVPLHEPP